MRCKKCGFELQKQNKYCPNCGNDLFADIDLWESSNIQNKAKKTKKSKRTKIRIYFIVFGSVISLLLLSNLLFLAKLINLEKSMSSQEITSNDLEEQIIENSSANDAESNITLLPTEQPSMFPEASDTSSQQISAIGVWSCYGLYENWEDESLCENEIPDEQLSERNIEENIALIVDKDYFQYYDEIGSWTQNGKHILLDGDDIANAGEFFQVNDNTLHEAIRGDIVIYKRIDDLSTSYESNSVNGIVADETEQKYILVSVTPSNCTLLNNSNYSFSIQLNYSAYSTSENSQFNKLKISLIDVDTDSPRANSSVSAAGLSIADLSVQRIVDSDYVTIKVYGLGPFFGEFNQSLLLLTLVYNVV